MCSWGRTVGLLVVLTAAGGCSANTSPPGGGSAGSGAQGHVSPPHKPESFFSAVSQLPSRLDANREVSAASAARRELLDIIRWLPELAADTDLSRAEWEQVQRLTGDLERAVSSSPPDWAAARTRVDELFPLAHRADVLEQRSGR
uniref:Uncharacterized protein n=1 Tax=Schlesneria paludicola TaxID=360056 RepID=A0A7C4LNY8_9PLAN